MISLLVKTYKRLKRTRLCIFIMTKHNVRIFRLTPSLPQPVKFQGWIVHICTLANSIFDVLITNLLPVLWILIEILSPDHVKWGQGLNDFKFGTFLGRFWSDGAASMAVKGLRARFWIPTEVVYLPRYSVVTWPEPDETVAVSVHVLCTPYDHVSVCSVISCKLKSHT